MELNVKGLESGDRGGGGGGEEGGSFGWAMNTSISFACQVMSLT